MRIKAPCYRSTLRYGDNGYLGWIVSLPKICFARFDAASRRIRAHVFPRELVHFSKGKSL
jgi:hypothetical protein